MHTEPNHKDRMVTDEHPGYDARAHYCGEDNRFTGTPELPWPADSEDPLPPAPPRPNLRRVRAWAEWVQAAWRIVTLLAVIVLAFAAGVYAESAVWR